MILKKNKNNPFRPLPFYSLTTGAFVGVILYAVFTSTGLQSYAYVMPTCKLSGIISLTSCQINFFIVCAISGFSSFSSAIPCAAVFSRSALAALSVAAAYRSMTCGVIPLPFFCVFTFVSAALCLLLTSSARVADIYHKKVPHTSIENNFDYVARQLYTMGFACILLIFYCVCSFFILK